MLTRKIDEALEALEACRRWAPALLALHQPGTPARAALEDLMAAADRADATLFRFGAQPPHVPEHDTEPAPRPGESS